MELITLLCLLSATWLFTTGAEPIQWLKGLINADEDSSPTKTWQIIAQRLLNCNLCSGFWIALIFYRSLVLASGFALLAEVFGRLVNKYINKI